jgi:hypothetical protein
MPDFFQHEDIDKKKWDESIKKSCNPLLYAESWYLDIVSPGWNALIEDDYQILMPLACSKKLMFRYILPPVYTKQLGIFYPDLSYPPETGTFVKAIPARYKYVNINFNQYNKTPSDRIDTIYHQNHELDLSGTYTTIYNGYSTNAKRNLKKAIKNGIFITEYIEIEQLVEFKGKHIEGLKPATVKKYMGILRKLANKTLSDGTGEIIGALTPRNELCAIAFFINTPRRHYFILCASSNEGKEAQAMNMVMDHYFKKHAANQVKLDFTGSDLKGVSYFNQSLGADVFHYFSICRNNLPRPLKRLFT